MVSPFHLIHPMWPHLCAFLDAPHSRLTGAAASKGGFVNAGQMSLDAQVQNTPAPKIQLVVAASTAQT